MDEMRREFRDYHHDRTMLLTVIALSILISMMIAIVGSSSSMSDAISIISFLLVVVCVYMRIPECLMKYLHFWIMSLWGILAVYFLENGSVYLRGSYSTHYGSLPIYVLGWNVFFAMIIFLELKRKHRLLGRKDKVVIHEWEENKMVLYVSYCCFVLVVIAFTSISYKPYFILGIDRFAYRQTVSTAFVSMVSSLAYCFIPVVMMTRKKHKRLAYGYLIMLALLCIWQGEKFSGLLRLIFFVMISISPQYVQSALKKNIKKVLIVAASIVLSLLIVVVIQQRFLGASNIGKYFQDRLAAQGEVWWHTYHGVSYSGTHLDELGDEISVWLKQPSGTMSDYNFGIYKLMKKYLNSGWVTYTLALNIRATEATRASFYYYAKESGLIIGQILIAILVYFVINRCSDFCNKKNLVKSVLFLYVLQGVISAVYMSDFQLLTTKKMLLVYAILIFSHRRTVKINNAKLIEP